MKVKDIFNSLAVSQSFSGATILLDNNNCVVENKQKTEGAVRLILKRESDGAEGHAYLRPRKEFSDITDPLLNWAFTSDKITGLTLSELAELETGLGISKVDGRTMLNRNQS